MDSTEAAQVKRFPRLPVRLGLQSTDGTGWPTPGSSIPSEETLLDMGLSRKRPSGF
ncbi:MAG: hypothetical protein V1758_11690 [Pseudomonadota bacterium]